MSRLNGIINRLCMQAVTYKAVSSLGVRPVSSFARTRSVFPAITCQQPQSRSYSDSEIPIRRIAPSKFDKQCLVKAKIFPSLEEVPETVTHKQLTRARDYMRMRVATWMMIFTVIGSVVMISWGRYDRSQGKSISKQYMEHTRKLREQGIQEEAERKAKESGN